MRKGRFRILLAGALTLLVILYHFAFSSLPQHEAVLSPVDSTEAMAAPDIPTEAAIHTPPASPAATSPATPEPATSEPAYEIQAETPEPSREPVQAAPESPWPKAPEGFVYLKEALPDAKFDVRYATAHNFTGQVVEGYESDRIFCTIEAAEALKKVNALVSEQGYGLLIYDAYRPKRAVDFFIQWGNTPEDYSTKAEFYPDFEKADLFKLGYLAKRSAHSRGSTIDLTLFSRDTGEPLDMGSPYDFLGPISNHDTKLITEEQTRNRNILREAMKAAGFKELRTEWWHYQLVNEPYPETFFDYPIR